MDFKYNSMTQPEYEQKKRECWEEFMRSTDKIITPRDAFSFAFNHAYALGKQEKDAEGEEMLIVSRKEVQEAYKERACASACYNKWEEEYLKYNSEMALLKSLFGSKCLPDEACNVASSDVASSKPKPAEPKFTKRGYGSL